MAIPAHRVERRRGSLTPTVVSGTTFGLLEQVTLDDQVDAQPLLVTGITIAGAEHDVAYVATENNSVYAVDASSGSLLLHVNLGTPVPQSQLPGACATTVPMSGLLRRPSSILHPRRSTRLPMSTRARPSSSCCMLST